VNCSISEEQLALYGGGDLSAQETASIAKHLTECINCRDTLADLQFSQRLFAESAVEPDRADLRSIRDGVMQRIGRRREQSRWIVAAAVALGAILIVTPILVRNRTPGDHHQAIATVELRDVLPLPIPALHLPERIAVGPVHNRSHKTNAEVGLRVVMLSTAPNGTSELRIATADPNVAIFFQMNGNTHEN
jgi:predicted anti-sigma-YlaC factor YlaD